VALFGCATSSTTFQTVAGKFLTSTAVTVDATMTAAAKAKVMGLVNSNDWAQVVTYYGKYQSDMEVATNLYSLAVQIGNPAIFTQASNNVQTSQMVVVTKVSTLPTH
jgi:hypothetical protein